MGSKETVCVTGASGFIGSWVVRLLLERGYSVRGTVQDLGNEKETRHLEAMEGAKERLELFQIDLLDYGSIETAINGSVGVFHLASPCIVEEVKNPQIWYPASKTLSEKAAWDFAKETGLDVVVINPGTVMGPILPPAINASMAMFLQLLQGGTDGYQNNHIGCVHVKDVAEGHILLYETPSASGRHLCVEATNHWSDFAEIVAKLYPEYKIHRFTEVTQPGLLRVQSPPKKLVDLGLVFTPMEQVIKDSVSSLKEKGFLN